MTHLEIFWKDDSIKPKEPQNEKSMNIFSDWGVVTIADDRSMLALKSGSVGGRAMHEIAYLRPSPFYPWLSKEPLQDFNFGHEHPDAGSFIYIPDNGFTIFWRAKLLNKQLEI